MRASVTIGILAALLLASATSVSAHSVERVRRELRSQGYDQIEFTRTKFPVWVNACRGSERVHLHVDWYGKVTVTDEPAAGSCPVVQAESENSTIAGVPVLDRPSARKAQEARVAPKEVARAPKDVGCKKYLPEIGMTVSVACD